MFAWTRKFYAEKDGVYYNFDRKRNRDDAVLNHGFAKVTAAEAHRHYPMVQVSWREYRNFIRMWSAEL